MKKFAKSISYSLVAVLTLSIVLGGPKLGPLGVDVVSAATGEATPPATTAPKPTTPAPKPTTPAPKPAPKPATPAPKAPVEVKAPAAAAGKVALKLGKAEFAAHGTKCYTVAAVAMAGDKIAAAYLDDYQVMAKIGSVAVSNSETDFGKNFAADKVLGSKRANADMYSDNMAKSAGATTPVDKSLDAIQAYATGKTVAELEKALQTNGKEKMVDAVSGATLVDTYGYVSAIVAAAKSASNAVEINAADLNTLKLGKVEFAAHGTKCFTVAFTAVAGGKIVGALVDDYQVMAPEGYKGVPNSDADFGKNVVGGKILVSKRANAAAYSANMAKSAGATTPVDKSLDAIQAYTVGKTTAELKKALETNGKEKMVDAVSGATLVDTYGYVSAIVAAAESTIPVADAVTSASLVNNEAAFEKAIGKEGTWIISTLKNLTFDKEIVVDGEFKNTKTPPATARKIALYTQDDKKNVTARFTLTAPKLTINSPKASIEHGTFKGDIYVNAEGFKLVDNKVVGNIYFANQKAKDTFLTDDKSTVTGKQFVAGVDVVTSASLTQEAVEFEKALRVQGQGTWIIAALNNMTFSKPLVLEGTYHNKNNVFNDVYRKIALYTQDDKHVTISKFTLTAPKLTIKSPNANISKGTFKGDIYVSAKGFQLVDTKVDGNVFFTTQEAKDTFKKDATSVITGVDAITTASIVTDAAAFEKAVSKDGSWIIATLKDITTDKALVLDGEFKNGKKDATTGAELIQRKIGLYTQDDKRVVTNRFTLKAPSLTINSPKASFEHGTFVGDIIVSVPGFKLVDATVTGNVYFTTQEAKDTFIMDAASSISGKQELKTK